MAHSPQKRAYNHQLDDNVSFVSHSSSSSMAARPLANNPGLHALGVLGVPDVSAKELQKLVATSLPKPQQTEPHKTVKRRRKGDGTGGSPLATDRKSTEDVGSLCHDNAALCTTAVPPPPAKVGSPRSCSSSDETVGLLALCELAAVKRGTTTDVQRGPVPKKKKAAARRKQATAIGSRPTQGQEASKCTPFCTAPHECNNLCNSASFQNQVQMALQDCIMQEQMQLYQWMTYLNMLKHNIWCPPPPPANFQQ